MVELIIEGLHSFSKSAIKILENLKDEDFKINYSELSKRLNIPVTTIYDSWNKIIAKTEVKVEITISTKEKGDKK